MFKLTQHAGVSSIWVTAIGDLVAVRASLQKAQLLVILSGPPPWFYVSHQCQVRACNVPYLVYVLFLSCSMHVRACMCVCVVLCV